MITPYMKATYTDGNVICAYVACDSCDCEILGGELAYDSIDNQLCEYCYKALKEEDAELYYSVPKSEFDETYGDEIRVYFLKKFRRMSPERLKILAEQGRARLRKMGYDV